MSIHLLNKTEPGEVSPKVFFEEVCPRVAAQRREEWAKLGGTFAFVISGFNGGAWTLDLAGARVISSAAKNADVHIDCDVETFGHLINGRPQLHEALTNGKLKICGDRTLLRNLGVALRPLDTGP
ncbi:MAG: hypothetical protein A2289_09220 [Deltaproteobacteria bacterium RIFOXYA12_FULL_58_15]|nr:MAG: hypothetical protein A2289_09220 [Deltaproteobacteria bacterium RIFOXYA12_FULL_58_15]